MKVDILLSRVRRLSVLWTRPAPGRFHPWKGSRRWNCDSDCISILQGDCQKYAPIPEHAAVEPPAADGAGAGLRQERFQAEGLKLPCIDCRKKAPAPFSAGRKRTARPAPALGGIDSFPLSSLGAEAPCAGVGSDDDLVCRAEEKPVGDDAGDPVEQGRQLPGVADRTEPCVQDPVSAVRLKQGAVGTGPV
jgi:hypothetical protein